MRESNRLYNTEGRVWISVGRITYVTIYKSNLVQFLWWVKGSICIVITHKGSVITRYNQINFSMIDGPYSHLMFIQLPNVYTYDNKIYIFLYMSENKNRFSVTIN